MNKEKPVANIENILTTMYVNHISIINMLLIYFFMYSVKGIMGKKNLNPIIFAISKNIKLLSK